MMAVELGMANQFVNDLSVDVKRGMRRKAERGWMAQSLLPIGYKHNKGYEKGEDEILSTPDLLIVKKLFSHFLEGTYSVADIHRKASALGLRNKKDKPYTHNTFIGVLQNPMYMGKFEWADIKGDKILIYPNPFQRELTVRIDNFSEPVSGTIYSNTGQALRNFILNDAVSELQLNDLKPGMYYVRIHNPENTKTFKIIKK
jgi:hypothetical protein